MAKKTSVTELVTKHLNRFGSITSGKIADFGVLNPYGIIDKLKRKGYVFDTEKLKKQNVTKYIYTNK